MTHLGRVLGYSVCFFSLIIIPSLVRSSVVPNGNTTENFEQEIKNLEKFEEQNENLISRNDLPCDNDAHFKIQCTSVRRAVRKWRQRSWMKGKTPHHVSQLFDEVGCSSTSFLMMFAQLDPSLSAVQASGL
jgi:hypothetical protein